MFRKHMTKVENEKQKRTMRMNAHTGILIKDLYPQVKNIEIHYEMEHRSFCDISHEKRIWTITPQDEVFFLLDCLNSECTSAGFDLRNEVSSAIHSHRTEVTGKMRCEGQEAHDHPEQSCGGHLQYTIKITYK